MVSINGEDIKSLISELGEYGESLGPLDDVSKDILEILNMSTKASSEVNHNVWIENLMNTQRFPEFKLLTHDNIFAHQVRLSNIVRELSYFFDEINFHGHFQTRINVGYLFSLALVHDDTEGINPLKDIPTNLKNSLSDKSKKILYEIEKSCIDVLSNHQIEHLKDFSKDELRGLYFDAESKTSLEGQLLSYLDKVDGFLFTLHEIYNGNTGLIIAFNNYINILKSIKEDKNKYPMIRFLIDADIDSLRNIIGNSFLFSNQELIGMDLQIGDNMKNRLLGFVELFNLEGLIKIDIDRIIKSDNQNNKSDYETLRDMTGIFTDSMPQIKSTGIIAYDAWKIAYSNVGYYNGGELVNGTDLMFKKD
ncbi:MAG: HD domain-containing protein [Candidatus Gracilibacteria bacterium]|nr:HD domain-containing protein [Candidatus Gracilibacteria bacterium]